MRQLIADGTFSFLDKDRRGDLKIVEDLHYIAAGNSPAGKKKKGFALKRRGVKHRGVKHRHCL